VLGADAPPIQIASLAHGTASGAPSIMLRLDLPDGRTVVAEMTLRMFVQAAKLLVAKHRDPDPDIDPPMVYMADLTGVPGFVRSGEEPTVWPGACSAPCVETLRSYISSGQHWLCDTHNQPVPTLWTDLQRTLALRVLEEQRGRS